jgi:uncharacterized cupredoxin-like copper-binding protein
VVFVARVSVSVFVTIGLVTLLVACSPAAARRDVPAGTDRVVELTMQGMHFIPDRVVVKAGELVAFVVTNPNDIPHELFIGTNADQAAHEAMHMAGAASAQAQVSHGGYGLFLPAHGTGVVSYRFDTPGDVLLGCHLPGHWAAGMVATVVVEP